MPSNGMNRQEYLNEKFDGKENAKQTYNKIYEEGVRNKIYFQFDKILKTPNSFASHKLLALAFQAGKQTQVVETLFYSYFIEGIDIGKIKSLNEIAKQYGLYNEKNSLYLESDEDDKNLLAEEKHARELGVKGVPCFIINKEFVVFGAQEKDYFLNIFKNIL